MIQIRFDDGSREWVSETLADRVVGKDEDGDLLVPLDDNLLPDYLIPLTPCCHASGKGWEPPTGIVCRKCFQTVDGKYGGQEDLFVAVSTPRYTCTDPECDRLHTADGGAL